MALRRNIRLRREYLYRKNLEGNARKDFDRKQQIRGALREGKAIPTELRNDEARLSHQISLEDDRTAIPTSHIDDEYAAAGFTDPKICITTSRAPSSKLKQFAKELKLIFPTSSRINRGNTKVPELVEACRTNNFTDIIVIQEHRGTPAGLIVCHLPYGPTAHFAIANVVTRHDIEDRGTMSEAFPHLIFEGFQSSLGKRVCNILKHLFPVPKADTRRVLTFVNRSDFISFRHHVYRKPGGGEVSLSEVGPRFELRPFQIRLGTLEQKEAEVEWALRPYMNTAKKRNEL